MKYIDAEKLIAIIDDRLHCNGAYDEVGDSSWHYDQGMVDAYKHLREVVVSLQQEKPEVEFNGVYQQWFNEVYMKKFPDLVDTAQYFYELGLKARKEE